MFQHFQIDEDSPLNLKHRQRASKPNHSATVNGSSGGGRMNTEEDGGRGGSGGWRRWKRRPQHLQIRRYKARNAAFDWQGACDDSNGGAAGWRRSAELLRPRRRRTAAAAGRWNSEMEDVMDPKDGGKMSDVWHIWWRGGRNTTCWHHFIGGENSR
jgi:hypothetical protein